MLVFEAIAASALFSEFSEATAIAAAETALKSIVLGSPFKTIFPF